MGRAIQRRGKWLEDRLNYLHGQYEQAGLAVVHPNQLTGHYVGKRFTPLPRSMPDYTGFIAPHGWGVMFDAKHTKHTTYRHATDRRHQLSTLYQFAQVGVIAFLLVVSGEPGDERGFLLWPQAGWEKREPYSVDLTTLTDDPYDSDVGCECIAWPYTMATVDYIPDWLNLVKLRYHILEG